MNEITHNAVVADKNLISFSGVSLTQRADILDLLMYADFFATQARRRETDWISWMNYYRSQLVSSGCELKSTIRHSAKVINSARELDSISFGVTGSVRIGGLMDLARRSFRAAGLGNYARVFFESGSGTGQLSTFQVVPCESTATGDVSILICGLHASASAVTEDLGGNSWIARDIVVRLAGGVYNFNTQRYGLHRQRIQSRLLETGRFNLQQINI